MMSGAPNDCFLLNAFKRCFRLSGVLLTPGGYSLTWAMWVWSEIRVWFLALFF